MADELQSSEELAFVAEEVDRIILTSIESCLKDEVYDEQKVSQWVDYICESIMKGLSELRKPLKYIVSCLIMQKNGAGVHASVSCHWDTVTDGAHVVKWPGDKHKDHNRSILRSRGAIGTMGRDDPVTYAGWVFKEGSIVRSWKKRFLVCKRAELAYYKNTDEENHAQLLGALTAAHIERLPDITNGLLIHGTEGRQLKIFTDTKAECDRCYEAISKFCRLQNPDDDSKQRVGWLEKEGQHFRTWKKRYFVLSGTQLTYSATMGTDRLGGGRVIGARRDPTRPFTLAVTFEGGREMRVGGKSEVDIDDWHKALRRGLLYAQEQRKSLQGRASVDDDPRNARDREFAKRQATANSEVTDEEASSLFGAAPMGDDDAPPAYSSVAAAHGDERKTEADSPEKGELKEGGSPPELYAASSFRRHIVVETMPDNTASFIEVAEERESEDNAEKPYSPTAPGTSTIRRMRLAEKLLQEELEEERREAMMKENTVVMREPSKSDAQDVKGCCCVVM
ncbi:hypothetical protein PF008_g7914 [Phytophthora fragariae]|nr:hypothetical protein PF008_g7914 [Phytophthora fragariae]